LRDDLQSLGVDGMAISTLPVCDRLPVLSGTAEQLGRMYVIKGSTLLALVASLAGRL
jgi:heme oxygenase